MKRTLVFPALTLAAAWSFTACPVRAAVVTWANTATDFNADASWSGGTAPADDTTTDIGVFSGTPAFQPSLTADRSIAGLRFDSDGWTLGGGFTLTLGSGDPNNLEPGTSNPRTVDLDSGGTATINANLALADNQDWAGNSGSKIIVNGQISGAAEMRFGDGDGTFPGNNTYQLNAANTYSGGTVVKHGTIELGNDQALGTGKFSFYGAYAAADPTFIASGGTRTIANRFGNGVRLAGSHDLTLTGGSAYSSGTARPTFENVGTGTLIIAGQIGDTSGGFATSVKEHTFTGSGTIRITGNTSNLGMDQHNNDGLIVEGDRVEFDKTPGADVSGGNTTVSGSGLGVWLGSDQLNDSRRLNLRGGTADFNGFDETTGRVYLFADSTLDLGGTSQLAFADSSGVDWAGNLLTIANFSLADSSLRFGTDASGLTPDQLADLSFTDFAGAGGQIDSQGFVTPVPEPASLALVLGGGLLMAGRRQRRGEVR